MKLEEGQPQVTKLVIIRRAKFIDYKEDLEKNSLSWEDPFEISLNSG